MPEMFGSFGPWSSFVLTFFSFYITEMSSAGYEDATKLRYVKTLRVRQLDWPAHPQHFNPGKPINPGMEIHSGSPSLGCTPTAQELCLIPISSHIR